MTSPFIRLLVKAVRSVRAAGLRRDPEEAKTASRPDWESFGRDLGRAVRKLRDGERRSE